MATIYGDISPRTAAYAEKELLKRGIPYLVIDGIPLFRDSLPV